MPFSLNLITDGIVLALIQVVVALPWALGLGWEYLRGWVRPAPGPRLGMAVGLLVGGTLTAGVLLAILIGIVKDREALEFYGRGYAALLQVSLFADLFVLGFALLVSVWPKGGAVARAAFRESYRQPMFWLFVSAASGLMILSPFIPYFTFGEDHIMVKELGFDTLMLAAVAFGAIVASMSISEEIEGRTAVTLMSKPISRRQFLLGKYFGILLACLVLVAGLGWFFQIVLLYKAWFDRLDPQLLTPAMTALLERQGLPAESTHFIRGGLLWVQHALSVIPGLIMSGALVMVLVAVAVSLATRLPMVVNLVTCLVLFFLANLMPVLVQTTRPSKAATAGPVQKLLHFMAQLFDALLPGLELFRVRPTLVDETSLPLGQYFQHVGAVGLYGILFTVVILLLGLVLFEDRDLA